MDDDESIVIGMESPMPDSVDTIFDAADMEGESSTSTSPPERPSTATVRVHQQDEVPVRVYCRVRPEQAFEAHRGGRRCVTKCTSPSRSRYPESVEMSHHGVDKNVYDFPFSRVFGPKATQSDVYFGMAEPVLKSVLSGVNSAIIAYGQTASGKTHTMEGMLGGTPDDMGLAPRICQELFRKIEVSSHSVEWEVLASYVEIYKERVYDLLGAKKTPLRAREDVKRGLWLPQAEVIPVGSYRDIFKLMVKGAANRKVAETNMNIVSSRSHSLFLVTVVQTDRVMQTTKVSQLYLCDLAGSERVCKSGAVGEVLNEAQSINKSLLALEQVVSALNEGNRSHIPYRDSKLTSVLRNALGGNSTTATIVTVSESSYSAGETLSTLRFGQRAQNVKNKPRVNQDRSVAQLKKMLRDSERVISEQSRLIDTLRGDIRRYREVVKAVTPMELKEDTESDTDSAPSVNDEYSLLIDSHRRDVLECGSLDSDRAKQLEAANSVFRDCLVQAPPQFMCPIWRTLMRSPVVCCDGHTYEKAAIDEWLKHSNISPMTGAQLETKKLTCNHVLKSLIESNPILQMYLVDQEKRDREEQYLMSHVVSREARRRREADRLSESLRRGGLMLFSAVNGRDAALLEARNIVGGSRSAFEHHY